MPKRLPPGVRGVDRLQMQQLLGWKHWIIDKSVSGYRHIRTRRWYDTFYHTPEKAGFLLEDPRCWGSSKVDLSNPERVIEWAWDMGYLTQKDYTLLLTEATLRLLND